MNLPLVSIIIPTFNRARLLARCINSIACQDYERIEVIVVDDGSTDDTAAVLENWRQSNPNIPLIYEKQENLGAPTARNRGVQLAKGEYLVFFDSDDVMLRERIRLQTECILSNNADACACGYSYSSSGECYLPPDVATNAISLFFSGKLRGSTQSWMFSKCIINTVGGYDTSLCCFQDNDIVFRVVITNAKVCTVCKALTVFTDEEHSRIMEVWFKPSGVRSIHAAYIKRLTYLTEHFDQNLVRFELRRFMTLMSAGLCSRSYSLASSVFSKSIALACRQHAISNLSFVFFLFAKELVRSLVMCWRFIIKNRKKAPSIRK